MIFTIYVMRKVLYNKMYLTKTILVRRPIFFQTSFSQPADTSKHRNLDDVVLHGCDAV
jgi:hypothetical protein